MNKMSKNAKPIMVQGTMSNAGKSLITAGLCRVFKQDGFRVAPFKSQNMALNSFITREGLEMGRAQVVQAEACGIEPSVLMNPVLLKPVTDMGSQVIVLGEVRGNMKAESYFKYKANLFPEILEAYRKLAVENDIIVIEGAGSPAEINLKADDIVNMGLAKRLRAPVLLVGDIDRGGVFAQLWGTVSLLDEDERAMIKALIINKFRGNLDILKPGLAMLEEKTGIPIAGVLRYLKVDIEDEDSLSERLINKRSVNIGEIDIAVIRLPKISNFTDSYALEASGGLNVRYVDRVKELGLPDMLIIPGTKNTIADLKWLRASGLESAVIRIAGQGVPVFGICGGFQMLGSYITDAEGVETPGGAGIRGMGLLPLKTVFFPEKRRQQISLRCDVFGAKQVPIEGYEIHMGVTVTDDDDENESAEPLPPVIQNNSVYGTYLHGFFDSAPCREALIRFLRDRKGAAPGEVRSTGEASSIELKQFDLKQYKEEQFDKLASAIREELDMRFIYKILEEGV
jgi:adenosylcobyric acid synthase